MKANETKYCGYRTIDLVLFDLGNMVAYCADWADGKVAELIESASLAFKKKVLRQLWTQL